jgi:succinoglycan biosynthesis protein ExoO
MKPIFRRKFLVDHRIEYNESMKIGEDFTLFVESLFSGAKIILIEEAYYIYSMPHAPSGRSPHSRSVYRFGGLVELSGMLERKYPDRISPALRRAMSDYRRTMTLLHQSDIARDLRRRGRYTEYAAYLAARPELARRLASRVAFNVLGRFLRASPQAEGLKTA